MEYYGIYDVMGFALPPAYNQLTALSTPFRVFQGVTDAGEIQDVDLGTKTVAVHATATIKPRSDGSGLRSVRVVDPDTGETLYLDYRSGTGEDAGSAYLRPRLRAQVASTTPRGHAERRADRERDPERRRHPGGRRLRRHVARARVRPGRTPPGRSASTCRP